MLYSYLNVRRIVPAKGPIYLINKLLSDFKRIQVKYDDITNLVTNKQAL